MERHILDDIPFEAEIEAVARRVHVELSGPLGDELKSYVEQAQAVARPKAMYQVGYVEERGEDWVRVGGQRFTYEPVYK